MLRSWQTEAATPFACARQRMPAGWTEWRTVLDSQRPVAPGEASPCPCQFCSQTLLRSQAGPHAGAWLAAVPAEPATTLMPQAMQVAAQTPASSAAAQPQQVRPQPRLRRDLGRVWRPRSRLPQAGPIGQARQGSGASVGARGT